MTEAERLATERMQEETAGLHPDRKVPGAQAPKPVHGNPAPETKESGTRVLPMPSDASDVAGMPRSVRVHNQPGDPGNPAPEAQQTGQGETSKS